MKKVTAVLIAACCLGATFAVAAPAKKKFVRSHILQGQTVTRYEGVKLGIPQGQTVLVGRRDNGSLVLRGKNLRNIQIEDTYLSTDGYSIVSYQPASHVVFLNKGNSMTVTDPAGRTGTVAQNGAISTTNAAVTSDTAANLKAAAEQEAKDVVVELGEELNEIPAFVEAAATTSAATEQAAQNVEDTLSASAPR